MGEGTDRKARKELSELVIDTWDLASRESGLNELAASLKISFCWVCGDKVKKLLSSGQYSPPRAREVSGILRPASIYL